MSVCVCEEEREERAADRRRGRSAAAAAAAAGGAQAGRDGRTRGAVAAQGRLLHRPRTPPVRRRPRRPPGARHHAIRTSLGSDQLQRGRRTDGRQTQRTVRDSPRSLDAPTRQRIRLIRQLSESESPSGAIHALHNNKNEHPFNGPFSGTTRVIRYQNGKTNLDFTGARESEWQWHQLGHMHICISLQIDNHANTPPLSSLQAGCPSCRPTNSVKALKAIT